MDIREIDLLVAKEIMGWEWLDKVTAWIMDRVIIDEQPVPIGDYCWSKPHIGMRLPCYSTEIAAAWDVIEKLRFDGHLIKLEWFGTGWRCQIDAYSADAPTAPLAICLAGLKAVEGTRRKSSRSEADD